MNHFIKARPAQKHPVKTAEEANPFDTSKSLAKIEGILTSPIKLKEPKDDSPYFWAFFQLEGIEQDIPVVFKIDSSVGLSEQTPPHIPPRSKVLLEGK